MNKSRKTMNKLDKRFYFYVANTEPLSLQFLTERGKLIDERTETTRELNDLSSQLVGHSRLRKADVEEARRNAENFGKSFNPSNQKLFRRSLGC